MADPREFQVNGDRTTPAHPAARVVTEFSVGALDRQVSQLNALDLKASFIGAAALALIAGFLTALATKPPTSQSLVDLAAITLLFAVAALGGAFYAWWPRPVDVPPHPRGLRERHWNDLEEGVLRAVADQIALTFDDLKTVEAKKAFGCKVSIAYVGIATVAGSIEVLSTIATGGSS
jgi:hypothetical protein